MNTLLEDLRLAGRRLARSPFSAAVAILAIAIGVAGATTIFSIANAFFLRPLPGVAGQDRLVNVHRVRTGADELGRFSYPTYREIQDESDVLSEVAAFTDHGFSLRDGGAARLIVGQIVSGNYFAVLGVPAAAGRLLRPEDDTPAADPVAVISHDLWRSDFGGARSVVGRTVSLNGHPFTVIGVAPPGFQGTFTGFPFGVWVPISQTPRVAPRQTLQDRERTWLELVGQLQDGVSMDEAHAGMELLARRLERERPDEWRDRGFALHRTTGVDDSLRAGLARFVGMLGGLAGLLLLIACTNVTGMLLVRSVGRRRELAIRAALGSGRRRLARQILTETSLLFVLGAVLAFVLAVWAAHVLEAFSPPLPIALDFDLSPDLRVGAFALALALAVGLGVGLVAALQAARPDLVSWLKVGDARSDGRGSRLRGGFVVGQVAMSVLLLVVTGLFIRTVQKAAAADPGFEPAGVHMADLPLTILDYSEAEGREFYRELLARTAAIGGVEDVSLAARVPLGPGRSTTRIARPGEERDGAFSVGFNVVTAGYLETMRIPIVSGRSFDDRDRTDSPPVALVNQTLAGRLWPERNPVGRRIVRDGVELEVVGIVRDGKYGRPWETAAPHFYLPFGQNYVPRMNLLVRSGDAAGLPAAVRRTVRELEADLPLGEVLAVTDYIAISVLPQRIAATVAGVLGLVGLVLAGIGLYAVVALHAAQRRREIGLRIAIGARSADVLGLVLRQGLRLGIAGVVLGMLAAAAATRVLSGFIFGVSATDPATFSASAILLLAVAVAASLLPAHRAARVDPMAVLRQE